MTSRSSALAALPLLTLLKTVTPSIHEDADVLIFLNHFLIITNVSNLLDTNQSLPLTTTIATGFVQIPDPALAQDQIQDLLAPPITVATTVITTVNPLQLQNLLSLTAKAAMSRMQMPLPAHLNSYLLTIPPIRQRIKEKAKKLHNKPLLLR